LAVGFFIILVLHNKSIRYHPNKIVIKESLSELKELERKSGHLIGKRLRILIAFKKYEETGISKRAVSENTGINHNSVTQKPIWHVYQKW
jgi:hypothetical protein